MRVTVHVPLFREVFLRRMRKIPRAASAELYFMQFLCIAKRVSVNSVNSNGFCNIDIWRVKT